MARSTIRVTGTLIEWVRPSGAIEFAFDIGDIAGHLRDAVLVYGAKQILSDAGAVGRDAPDEERLAKMAKRARALTEGTWNYRDGHGASATERVRDVQFSVLCELGALEPDMAEAWVDLKPSERTALVEATPGAAEAVAARLPKPAADPAAVMAKIRSRIGR